MPSAQGSTQAAAEAEAALQRQLARKLGILGAKRRALADAAAAATDAAAHGPDGAGGAGAPWSHIVGREWCYAREQAGRMLSKRAGQCARLVEPGSGASSSHKAEAGM